ncbi:MAG: hypothetical protein HY618_01205 [Candidatus Tectomicrobia bacterium]|uniref:Selenoprotein B glycine/betaine/sarcosine/D-proline reductase n=1 Tax=Tectimicrobiota bacterium TaxID=2528274 RepID=A0A932ZSK9_UNCTE|nr:hypothetical protein [Candidatus Tectomicrobia bacterium]
MVLRRAKNRLIARALGLFPSLVDRWARGRSFAPAAGDEPWAALAKPLAGCRLALVTTGGVHLKSQAPFDMAEKDGDPTFREIPSGAPRGELVITHDYYDHRDADRDINVVFPLDRLAELAAGGRIQGPAPLHLGFMGHVDGPLAGRLVRETAPAAARRLAETGADAVLLTPA